MKHQTTAHILMVRPANFGFNEETAVNNAFQKRGEGMGIEDVSASAMREFDGFVAKLRAEGIDVVVAMDSDMPVKPDAIFPNNWISTHEDGTVVTYPMFSPVRRLERQEGIEALVGSRFEIKKRVHLEHYEGIGKYLEGTGSMILDRQHEVVYACGGPRTDKEVLDDFCELVHYKRVLFDAVDAAGQAIYHTNVMMAMGEGFVVICMDAIRDDHQRGMLIRQFEQTKKDIIEISLEQMGRFAGNMLQVRNRQGKTYLVMSDQAFESLNGTQIAHIYRHTRILHADIRTIETLGGGSARCMMAEIFLPEKPLV